jgi:hypothetical protein
MIIKGANYHVGHEKKHRNINSQTQKYKYSSTFLLTLNLNSLNKGSILVLSSISILKTICMVMLFAYSM